MKNAKGSGAVVRRLLRTIREFYPVMLPITIVCIVINAVVSSIPSIFSVTFGLEKNEDARDWGKADSGLYKKLAAKVFEKGVLIDEDPREPFCLCYSHSEADIDFTIEAFRQAVKEL